MNKNKTSDKIRDIRDLMKERGIGAYIVPNYDPHLSEYPPKRWRVRRWISGFTGSAGIAVITTGKAALWSDSRYFLQAEKELEGTEFIFFKEGLPGTPDIYEWIEEQIKNGGALAIDDEAFSYSEGVKIENLFAGKGIKVVSDFKPIDKTWTDRPEIPSEKIFEYKTEYAGESYTEKREKILAAAAAKGCNAVLLTALDDIAWAFNIRGTDVPFNPVALAYGYIGKTESVIFTAKDKIDEETNLYFTGCNIKVMPYDAIYGYLQGLPSGEKVLADPSRTNYRLGEILKNRGNLIQAQSPAMLMKSIKNNTEIKGLRKALVRDGVVMVNFLHWIDTNIGKIPMTELSVSEKLHILRAGQPMFRGESFSTISGYGPHGAIVHYSANEESNAELRPEGFLLIDSGGQYLDGTTDITRTVPLGKLTQEEIRNFTLVLKGHIAIATAQFPEGTRGAQLDALARMPLWRRGLTYMHGTGHGIGHFLNVHEGPQNIRLEENPAPLKPGMTTSNEPGVYLAGSHGIRTENMTLVEERFENEFGKFYGFETLTLCPIDTRAIDAELLSDEEIKWLDNYHREVYNTLAHLLGKEQKKWLEERCAPINR